MKKQKQKICKSRAAAYIMYTHTEADSWIKRMHFYKKAWTSLEIMLRL